MKAWLDMSARLLSNLESSINNYDNTGIFEIGFLMFLFGFALVFWFISTQILDSMVNLVYWVYQVMLNECLLV